MRPMPIRRGDLAFRALALFLLGLGCIPAFAGEPDPKTYWDVKDLRPGMKGVGKTVMVGTKLEEFGAEVLGVMRDVSPGRDMVLCRLTGCNLEHAGIIQGMSGSPIYIDGKLVGAVAFAWEFAKDPIAGVTPFQQMVQYVRSNDRRIAAEAKDTRGRTSRSIEGGQAVDRPRARRPRIERGRARRWPVDRSRSPAAAVAGMTPIVTPLAATGFSPRALSLLEIRLRPLGMAPMAGGAAPGARDPRGRRPAPRARCPAQHRHGHGRLRPLGHRHGDARRGQPGLRLRPPDVQPGLVRDADDDRLHPHGLSAGQRQHEDGLAAQGRGRARHRRQHGRRRPGRAQARHAADERPRQDGPVCRARIFTRSR